MKKHLYTPCVELSVGKAPFLSHITALFEKEKRCRSPTHQFDADLTLLLLENQLYAVPIWTYTLSCQKYQQLVGENILSWPLVVDY
jgi:hypothetical protein